MYFADNGIFQGISPTPTVQRQRGVMLRALGDLGGEGIYISACLYALWLLVHDLQQRTSSFSH